MLHAPHKGVARAGVEQLAGLHHVDPASRKRMTRWPPLLDKTADRCHSVQASEAKRKEMAPCRSRRNRYSSTAREITLDLNAYILSLLTDAENVYTPASLQIPAGLGQKFGRVLRSSENDVVERGLNLHWLPASQGPMVACAPVLYTGDHESVNLESAKACLEMPYIGDFHVHPYAQRYGPHVSIGPSSEDWIGWHDCFPTYKKSGVFFVASGSDLFLVLFRRKPAALHAPCKRDSHRLREQREKLNKYQNHEFTEATERKNWSEYRQLMTEHAPKGAKWHDDDVHAMNREFAAMNGCEYYRGKLMEKGVSYLSLESQRLVGNALTARIWSKRSQPWIHSRLF